MFLRSPGKINFFCLGVCKRLQRHQITFFGGSEKKKEEQAINDIYSKAKGRIVARYFRLNRQALVMKDIPDTMKQNAAGYQQRVFSVADNRHEIEDQRYTYF